MSRLPVALTRPALAVHTDALSPVATQLAIHNSHLSPQFYLMDHYLAGALEAIDETVGGLPVKTIARPPADPTRWSIAQILEHLTLAFRANRAMFEKALASGELRARRPLLKQRVLKVLVVDFGYFPRATAPEMTRPSGSIPVEESVPAIRMALESLDATLTQVATRFGSDVLAANHPYFAGLSVAQWRKFHWRHTLHHMQQVSTRLR